MTDVNALRIGGIVLVLGGLAFLVAGHSYTQQDISGAAAALLGVGSSLIALAANQDSNGHVRDNRRRQCAAIDGQDSPRD